MLSNTRKPNLFLIGAPKCGTTSLAYYLSQHSNVAVSSYKEPHFFAHSFSGRDVTSIDDYMALFRDANASHMWLLDASVLYMYFVEPIRNIILFNPNARCIAMVRDPMTMVPSWFAQMQLSRHGRETEKTLEAAWLAISKRKYGERVPSGCTDVRILFYDKIAMYAEQLKSVFDTVGRERVHVIVFDDLKKKPAEVWYNLCSFLDIDREQPISFEARNTRAVWRSTIISRMFRSPLRPLARSVLTSIGLQASSTSVRKLLFKSAPAMRPSQEAQNLIRQCYRQDVSKLEELLGRPLRGWLGGEA